MHIFIFDPSMGNDSTDPSTNLGDLIIRRAVDNVLEEIFPRAKVTRTSTHKYPSDTTLGLAQNADLTLVAGTNLLSSYVQQYNQWKLLPDMSRDIDLRAILLGVGWWQYQDDPDAFTTQYYQRILDPGMPHSVRDGYTAQKLLACGIASISTSCPTLWKLDGHETGRRGNNRRCLFCLTDYNPAPQDDDQLIRLLVKYYPDGLIFFPQGKNDEAYIATLPAFKEYASLITQLPHDINSLYSLQNQEGIDYVGTRLHAGAWCLEHNFPSLILAVDNRSTEIAKDVHLPVVARNDRHGIEMWLQGGPPNAGITLPIDAIEAWKSTLVQYG